MPPKTKNKQSTFEDSSQRLSPELIERMKATIQRYGGSEILFVCKTDESGLIARVEDIARGNAGQVPVPKRQLEEGDVLIHNHPSGNLQPSDADLRLASQLIDEGIACWIVDNGVEKIYPITEPLEVEEKIFLDETALTEVLGPKGIFAKSLKDFQLRPGQVHMVSLISRAFNTDAIAALEAGTGLGKSFAYLIPAMTWAVQNKERVVLSTATINLQQQLIEKDIPLISKLLKLPVKAVLAKGRGNYVCLKRLDEALDEEGLYLEEDAPLNNIAQWSKNTQDGSKADLSFIPEDILWSRINADADSCPGLSCPKREACFFFKARREAASAQLVVANHHLVFADAAMRNQGLGFESSVVLPSFKRLVFDEAHNLENSAVDFFALSLNKFMLQKYLSLLIRRRRGKVFGVLAQISNFLPIDLLKQHNLTLGFFEDLIFDCREAMRLCDEQAFALLGENFYIRFLIEQKDQLAALVENLGHLQTRLQALIEAIKSLVALIDSSEEVREIPGLADLQILLRRFSSLALSCDTFRNYQTESERVIWVERQRLAKGEAFCQFLACPLDIAPRLKESIFQPYPTVILTSATLTIGGEFSWWSRRIGLWAKEPKKIQDRQVPVLSDEWADSWASWDDLETEHPGPVKELVGTQEAWEELYLEDLDKTFFRGRFESPFDYKSRVFLGIPQDAPAPQSPEYQSWLNRFIETILLKTEGHGLVLFTSYDMLSKTFEAVSPSLSRKGIAVFKQGDFERSKLLKSFNTDLSSCLFATESFWEGVDSPGEALQVLILCKLPFRVPTEPLQLARSEAIEARGGNPFMDLSIPEAVMKFRQGFGRLMRRQEDYGLVMVPDTRLVTKAYGKIFLQSLPDLPCRIQPSAQLIENSFSFLDAFRGK